MLQMCRLRLLLIALCLTVFGVSAQGQQAPTLLPPKPIDAQYIIQPKDVLEIFVWKDANLSRTQVLVLPDGRISSPLIQEMKAAGLTTGQLKTRLEDTLSVYVDAPNVTVMVQALHADSVLVMGKVGKTGEIKITEPISVMMALAYASPFLEFAKLDEILIIRGSGESSNLFKFNLSEFTSNKNKSQNMLLKPGDVVFVP